MAQKVRSQIIFSQNVSFQTPPDATSPYSLPPRTLERLRALGELPFRADKIHILFDKMRQHEVKLTDLGFKFHASSPSLPLRYIQTFDDFAFHRRRLIGSKSATFIQCYPMPMPRPTNGELSNSPLEIPLRSDGERAGPHVLICAANIAHTLQDAALLSPHDDLPVLIRPTLFRMVVVGFYVS